MNRFKKIFLGLCLIPVCLFAQNPSGVTIQRERVFTGAGLYGFMNGGAELYLEYGVNKLTTRDLSFNGINFTLDIYELPTPEDAFGIYSLQVFKCQRADTLGCFDCLSPNQLQTAVGNKYITIVFQADTEKARKAADELFRLYVTPDSIKKLNIPSILAVEPPYSSRLKFARGPLSASWILPDFSSLLENIAYSGIWCEKDKTSKENKVLIFLKTTEDVQKLKERLKDTEIVQNGEQSLFFRYREKEAPPKDDKKREFGF